MIIESRDICNYNFEFVTTREMITRTLQEHGMIDILSCGFPVVPQSQHNKFP
jgi:hypothetical protein